MAKVPHMDPVGSVGLLVLRLVSGGAMLFAHGWPKLMKFFGEGPVKFADPLGLGAVSSLALATFAELLCAGMLVIGVWTRWAAIPLIVTMAVAVFIVHLNDPFSKQELPLMYLSAYIVLLLAGPGKYSLDYLIKK